MVRVLVASERLIRGWMEPGERIRMVRFAVLFSMARVMASPFARDGCDR